MLPASGATTITLRTAGWRSRWTSDYRETGEHFHEQFYEYTYDLDTIQAALEKHGFVLEKVCDGESFGPLTEESERYFFCAVKQYTQLEEKENV